jgi:hypothetical protein
VLVVGRAAPPGVVELIEMARMPDFAGYFAEKGARVSKRFADLNLPLPIHGEYGAVPPAPPWRRAVSRARRVLGRLARNVRPA